MKNCRKSLEITSENVKIINGSEITKNFFFICIYLENKNKAGGETTGFIAEYTARISVKVLNEISVSTGGRY